jgi:para-nitrobenzyl esterase
MTRSGRNVWKWIALGIACGLGVSSVASAQGHPAPVVQTTEGLVRGEIDTFKNRITWLGIPYAAPPVSARRWQPPASPASHLGIFHATQTGSACPQDAGPFGVASQNEDCLYLNVYAPFPKPAGAPVMVYIHPGSLLTGTGNSHDPTGLVQRGIVVVTINYRLGALGFLAHPALSAEAAGGVSGNYGIMDQQRALGWIQQNIAAFGGDPGKVTLFGHSAGGLSVYTHMASPASAGLFHGGIASSGAYQLNGMSRTSAEMNGTAFANAAGCTSQDADCLRGLSVSAVLAAQTLTRGPFGYLPTVGGLTLPVSPLTAFATGNFNQVPVIAGSTHDEHRLFVALFFDLRGILVTPANYVPSIMALLGVTQPVALFLASQYPPAAYPSAAVALSALGTDAIFACNGVISERLISNANVPTYAYEFNDANAPQIYLPPVSFPYGAYHIGDVPYVVDTTATFPTVFTPAQQTLSGTMLDYWATFARFGNPNIAPQPAWPAFSLPAQSWQSFQTPTVTNRTNFVADHKCALFGAP